MAETDWLTPYSQWKGTTCSVRIFEQTFSCKSKSFLEGNKTDIEKPKKSLQCYISSTRGYLKPKIHYCQQTSLKASYKSTMHEQSSDSKLI